MKRSSRSLTKQESLKSIDSDLQCMDGCTVERHWLGSLSIPFSTLLHNSMSNRIEGTFALEIPVTLTGSYNFDENSKEIINSAQQSTPMSRKGTVSGRESRAGATTTSSTKQRSQSRISSRMSGDILEGNVFPLENECTLLTLFLTLDPPHSLNLIDKDSFSSLKSITSEEDDLLLSHIESFERQVKNETVLHNPSRRVSCLGISVHDLKDPPKTVLLNRLLSSLKPPDLEFSTQNYLDVKEIVKRIARFVSLIPCLPSSSSCNIWLTCQSFLDLGIGSTSDHALLLCNYLLYLGKRCGLLLGHGIPEGSTTYVIQWEFSTTERDIFLWNPMNGIRYSVRDPFIPLTSVGCLVFPDNIYANIQSTDHPNRVDFEIEKQGLWKPLFGNKRIPGLSIRAFKPIQNEIINYRVMDVHEVSSLEEMIEKHLKTSLIRWRTNHKKTFFNRSCSIQVRNILPRLESMKTGITTDSAKVSTTTKKRTTRRKERRVIKESSVSDGNEIQELKELQSLHKLVGFPLNLSFSDLKSVSDAVFATGVHESDSTLSSSTSTSTEFVVSVYAHPYPCNIISLWVYVAYLHT